jgi:transposase
VIRFFSGEREELMSRSYSRDLRVRVIEAISGGLSTRKAAARFGIGVSTAGAWMRRYRETGEIAARKQGQPGGSKLDAHEAFILGLVADRADISLVEIAEALATEHDLSACPATVWYFFDRRGISFKKNRARHRARAA